VQANGHVIAGTAAYTAVLVFFDSHRDDIPADSILGHLLWNRDGLQGLSSSTTNGISFIMALLISFRLHESYQRWYEARETWGLLVTTCSDLCRAAHAYIASSAPRGLKEPGCQHIFDCASASPLLLKNFLRDSNDKNSQDLTNLGLSDGTIEMLLPSDGQEGQGEGALPWRRCLTIISGCIDDATKDGYLNMEQASSMEESVTRAAGVGGVCTRISSTPLNYAVSLHIRSTLVLHFMALPLICVAKQLSTAWSIAIISMNLFVILSLDQIAHHLETPFSLQETGLPLESFCNHIAKNTEFYIKMDLSGFRKYPKNTRTRADKPESAVGTGKEEGAYKPEPEAATLKSSPAVVAGREAYRTPLGSRVAV
jgi:putative membrane protein